MPHSQDINKLELPQVMGVFLLFLLLPSILLHLVHHHLHYLPQIIFLKIFRHYLHHH
jgi:hypothetical protein